MMKNIVSKVILTASFLFCGTLPVFAFGPGAPDREPIDTNLWLLLVAGIVIALFAARKYRLANNKK